MGEANPRRTAGKAREGQPGGEGNEQQPTQGFRCHHEMGIQAHRVQNAVADGAEGLHTEEEGLRKADGLSCCTTNPARIQRVQPRKQQVDREVNQRYRGQKGRPRHRQRQEVGLTPMSQPATATIHRNQEAGSSSQPLDRSIERGWFHQRPFGAGSTTPAMVKQSQAALNCCNWASSRCRSRPCTN